ncbi:MAG: hypothetical protein EBX76_01870 [Acidimicrobiia bacterium]|nr:hypothetical protein [Acidimicrobiia bacterium]
MLKRIGVIAHAHRRVVVAIWLAIIVALAAGVGVFGNSFSLQFNLPNVESAQGFDLLEERFGGDESGRSGTIVVRSAGGFNETQQSALNDYFALLDGRPDLRVVSPFSAEGARQVSPRGTIAFATVTFPAEIDAVEQFQSIYQEMKAVEPVVDGVQIEYGGEVFAEFEAPTSEVLGLAFAIVILIFAFGSVLAMGLPIGTAFGGIGVGVLVVTLASNLFTIPDVATTLGVMIGLGVGIDYALFIVTRYRESRRRGNTCADATAEAINTAGRAVIFAGTTVVISLLGMLIMGVSFMNGLAIGASITVLFTMLASVTLLPALLGFVGDRVEITRWRGVVSAGLVAVTLVGYGLKQQWMFWAAPLAALVLVAGSFIPALRTPLATRRVKPMHETTAFRWSRVVQRRPWTSLVVGAGVLLVIALPVLDLRLGFADEGNYPADTTTKRVAATTRCCTIGVAGTRRNPGCRLRVTGSAQQPRGAHRRVVDAVSNRRPAIGRGRQPRLRAAQRRVAASCRRQRPRRQGHRHGGGQRRLQRLSRRSSADLLCRRARSLVRAPDGSLPLVARAVEGRDHEPAFHRFGLRCSRCSVSVGMGFVARRAWRQRAD